MLACTEYGLVNCSVNITSTHETWIMNYFRMHNYVIAQPNYLNSNKWAAKKSREKKKLNKKKLWTWKKWLKPKSKRFSLYVHRTHEMKRVQMNRITAEKNYACFKINKWLTFRSMCIVKLNTIKHVSCIIVMWSISEPMHMPHLIISIPYTQKENNSFFDNVTMPFNMVWF